MGGLVGFYELAEGLGEVEGLEDRVGVAVQGADRELLFVPRKGPRKQRTRCCQTAEPKQEIHRHQLLLPLIIGREGGRADYLRLTFSKPK